MFVEILIIQPILTSSLHSSDKRFSQNDILASSIFYFFFSMNLYETNLSTIKIYLLKAFLQIKVATHLCTSVLQGMKEKCEECLLSKEGNDFSTEHC